MKERKVAKKNKSFPETIYVRQERDVDTEYLVADDTVDGAVDEDGIMIAVYQLVEVRKGRIAGSYLE